MKRIPTRRITEQEAAVIGRMLRLAPLRQIQGDTINSISELRVIGECECGCRSIEFEAPEGHEQRLADGVGFLPSGESVDIIVWGRENEVSSLEIVDHMGAGELPEPDMVYSWTGAASR